MDEGASAAAHLLSYRLIFFSFHVFLGTSCSTGFPTDLNITAVDVHPSDHAALCGHVGPVNHLLSIVEVQGHSVVQALSGSTQD